MNINERYNPVINGFKICKVCKENKELFSNFSFHKSTGYYLGTCKDCENRKRRLNHFHTIVKTCIICKRQQNISNFPFSKSANRFSSYCKFCNNHKTKPQRSKEYNKLNYRKNRISFIIRDYKKVDKAKNLENDLNKIYVEEQLKQPCVYCSHPSTGLDRINNSIGHIQSNCVACCKECNIGRMDNFTHQEMKIIGLAVKQVKDTRLCQL